jgi:hypothetical protein
MAWDKQQSSLCCTVRCKLVKLSLVVVAQLLVVGNANCVVLPPTTAASTRLLLLLLPAPGAAAAVCVHPRWECIGLPCPPGYTRTTNGTCRACPAGTSTRGNGTWPDSCSSCSPGGYAAGPGCSSCLACPSPSTIAFVWEKYGFVLPTTNMTGSTACDVAW